MQSSSSSSSKGEESSVEKAISEFLNEDNGPVTSRGAYDPSDAHYAKEQQRKSRKREMIREQEERKQVKKFKQAASKLGSEPGPRALPETRPLRGKRAPPERFLGPEDGPCLQLGFRFQVRFAGFLE